MRKDLKERLGERSRYKGTFEKYGVKSSYRGWPKVTILLTEVRSVSSNRLITDHLWFNETKGFQEIGPLYPGDIVAFDGRVKPYEKGYVSKRNEIDTREIDYKLSHPTKIVIINYSKSHLEYKEGLKTFYSTCPQCGYHNTLETDTCRRCSYRFNVLKTLRDDLEKIWSRETSQDPKNWTLEKPSYGQCYVTALLVCHVLGGELLRCDQGDGAIHYWNRLPIFKKYSPLVKPQQEVDLTSDQFGLVSPKAPDLEGKVRKNPNWKNKRYLILLRRYEDLHKPKKVYNQKTIF